MTEAEGGGDGIRWLLEQSGIGSHLSTAADTIALEAQQARKQCPGAEALPASLVDELREAFGLNVLRHSIELSVDLALTPGEVNVVRQWMLSPPGMQVRSAENAVSQLDEASFDAASARLVASEGWTPERRALISSLLRASGTAGFFTAINTELSAAVHLAGACSSDDASSDALDAIIADERRDESFYAVFMALELIVPTGVVFESLSDAEVMAYLTFLRTPAGKRYHAVLIESTRSALRAGVARLRAYRNRV